MDMMEIDYNKLSSEALGVLFLLRGEKSEKNGFIETIDGVEWGYVYLDNCFSRNPAFRRSLRGYLSALAKAGLYRQIDGQYWGAVRIEG
jgi:hypothetical protein